MPRVYNVQVNRSSGTVLVSLPSGRKMTAEDLARARVLADRIREEVAESREAKRADRVARPDPGIPGATFSVRRGSPQDHTDRPVVVSTGAVRMDIPRSEE